MQTWRLLHTGKGSAAFNMAVDEAVMIAHSRGEVPPTLRLYGWDPPTLSIGYFQRAGKEVDFEALSARGMGLCVGRPGAGRSSTTGKSPTAWSCPNLIRGCRGR